MSTGAQVILQRLLAEGIEVCFANPGNSEMHFVAALDTEPDSGPSIGLPSLRSPRMRPVLCLFEGVAGRLAATLLHLGPGMANEPGPHLIDATVPAWSAG